MDCLSKSKRYCLRLVVLLVAATACGPKEKFDQFHNAESVDMGIPSGSIIITSNSNATTGPGIISVWTELGELDRVIYDYTKVGIGYASGLALLPEGKMLAMTDTGGGASNDFLDLFSYDTPFANPINLFSSLTSGGAATYVRQLALITDTTTNRYLAFASESGSGRIARLSAAVGTSASALNFVRDFNFVANGTCTLATPYGVAAITGTTNIGVVSSAASGRINIFDSNGTCVGSSAVTNFPTGIAYHEPSGKLVATYATTSAVFAHNATTGAASPVTAIYTSAPQLSTPRAIATDSAGFIYVGSDALDQVIKLYWDGVSPAATYLGVIIPASVFTQNITSITVVP